MSLLSQVCPCLSMTFFQTDTVEEREREQRSVHVEGSDNSPSPGSFKVRTACVVEMITCVRVWVADYGVPLEPSPLTPVALTREHSVIHLSDG